MKTVKAVVRAVCDGRHGRYAIATVEGFKGSITFSLNPDVWQEQSVPESRTEVVLSDLRHKQQGWRAMSGRFARPSDFPATSNQQGEEVMSSQSAMPELVSQLPLPNQGRPQSGKPQLLLVSLLIDDSGSILQGCNDGAIRRGHNSMIEEWRKSGGNMLVSTRYLNGAVLYDYCQPTDAVLMNVKNYQPVHGTPLYDQTVKFVCGVRVKAADLQAEYDVSTMSFIFTDGRDEGSVRYRSRHVKTFIDSMLAEGNHIVAGVGVRDGCTDFERVFTKMGILPQWIKVLERTDEDIRAGMQQFSSLSSSVSSGESSFDETRLHGFGDTE